MERLHKLRERQQKVERQLAARRCGGLEESESGLDHEAWLQCERASLTFQRRKLRELVSPKGGVDYESEL